MLLPPHRNMRSAVIIKERRTRTLGHCMLRISAHKWLGCFAYKNTSPRYGLDIARYYFFTLLSLKEMLGRFIIDTADHDNIERQGLEKWIPGYDYHLSHQHRAVMNLAKGWPLPCKSPTHCSERHRPSSRFRALPTLQGVRASCPGTQVHNQEGHACLLLGNVRKALG